MARSILNKISFPVAPVVQRARGFGIVANNGPVITNDGHTFDFSSPFCIDFISTDEINFIRSMIVAHAEDIAGDNSLKIYSPLWGYVVTPTAETIAACDPPYSFSANVLSNPQTIGTGTTGQITDFSTFTFTKIDNSNNQTIPAYLYLPSLMPANLSGFGVGHPNPAISNGAVGVTDVAMNMSNRIVWDNQIDYPYKPVNGLEVLWTSNSQIVCYMQPGVLGPQLPPQTFPAPGSVVLYNGEDDVYHNVSQICRFTQGDLRWVALEISPPSCTNLLGNQLMILMSDATDLSDTLSGGGRAYLEGSGSDPVFNGYGMQFGDYTTYSKYDANCDIYGKQLNFSGSISVAGGIAFSNIVANNAQWGAQLPSTGASMLPSVSGYYNVVDDVFPTRYGLIGNSAAIQTPYVYGDAKTGTCYATWGGAWNILNFLAIATGLGDVALIIVPRAYDGGGVGSPAGVVGANAFTGGSFEPQQYIQFSGQSWNSTTYDTPTYTEIFATAGDGDYSISKSFPLVGSTSYYDNDASAYLGVGSSIFSGTEKRCSAGSAYVNTSELTSRYFGPASAILAGGSMPNAFIWSIPATRTRFKCPSWPMTNSLYGGSSGITPAHAYTMNPAGDSLEFFHLGGPDITETYNDAPSLISMAGSTATTIAGYGLVNLGFIESNNLMPAFTKVMITSYTFINRGVSDGDTYVLCLEDGSNIQMQDGVTLQCQGYQQHQTFVGPSSIGTNSVELQTGVDINVYIRQPTIDSTTCNPSANNLYSIDTTDDRVKIYGLAFQNILKPSTQEGVGTRWEAIPFSSGLFTSTGGSTYTLNIPPLYAPPGVQRWSITAYAVIYYLPNEEVWQLSAPITCPTIQVEFGEDTCSSSSSSMGSSSSAGSSDGMMETFKKPLTSDLEFD